MAGVQTITEVGQAEVLFNDTEGLDFNDLNNVQRVLRRAWQQGYLERTLNTRDVTGALQDGNFRPVGNALRTYVNAGMQVGVAAGSVMQLVTDPGSPDYGDIVYTKGTNTLITVDAADPTNPRWDILSAKLDKLDAGSVTRKFRLNATTNPSSAAFNKERQYRLTITYTPGTPAGSPAEPSVPGGQFKIARIIVPAAAGSLGTTGAAIVDWRIPAGRVTYITQYGFSASGQFTQDGNGLWTAASSANVIRVPILPPGRCMTTGQALMDMVLAGIEVTYKLSAGSTVKLVWRPLALPTTWNVLADISSLLTLSGTQQTTIIQRAALDAANLLPIWSNGGGLAATGHVAVAGDPSALVCLEITANAGANSFGGVAAQWYGI